MYPPCNNCRCVRVPFAQGYCQACYRRLYRQGKIASAGRKPYTRKCRHCWKRVEMRIMTHGLCPDCACNLDIAARYGPNPKFNSRTDKQKHEPTMAELDALIVEQSKTAWWLTGAKPPADEDGE